MEHQKVKEWGQAVGSAFSLTGGAQGSDDKSVAQALVVRYEKLDKEFAILRKLLDQPDYKDWDGAMILKDGMATHSVAAEKLLKQIDAQVAKDRDEIAKKLEEAEKWAAENRLLVQKLVERKTGLLKAAAESHKAGTAAVKRGTAKDREEMEAEAAPAVATLTEACKKLMVEDAAQTLVLLESLVNGLGVRVNKAFETSARKLETMRGGEVGRVVAQSTGDEKKLLANSMTLVERALEEGTLDDVGKAFLGLEGEIKSIDEFHAEALKAKGDYDGIKERYDAVMKIDAKSLAKEDDKKKLNALQGRLKDTWDAMTSFVEDGDWNTVSDDIVKLSKLLDTANGVLGDNQQALKSIGEAEERQRKIQEQNKEAARLLEEQLQQQRAQQYELDKQAGLQAGNQLFDAHSNAIVQKVWKETRKHVPHGENCSISGVYGLEAIQAAISIWNGTQVYAGLFNSCWVPGGGRIQDKRSKSRNEVQGNFISGWGTHGDTVNVHVDLRPEDWDRLPRV